MSGSAGSASSCPGPKSRWQPSPYAVLGLRRTATQQEVKSAYHALCKRLHPDKDLSAPKAVATARFQQLKAAYDLLSDPARRRALDSSVVVATAAASPRTGTAAVCKRAASRSRTASGSNGGSTRRGAGGAGTEPGGGGGDSRFWHGGDEEAEGPPPGAGRRDGAQAQPQPEVMVLDSDEEEHAARDAEWASEQRVFESQRLRRRLWATEQRSRLQAREAARAAAEQRRNMRKQQQQRRQERAEAWDTKKAREGSPESAENAETEDMEEPEDEDLPGVPRPMCYVRLVFKKSSQVVAPESVEPTAAEVLSAFADFRVKVVSISPQAAVLAVPGDEAQAVACALSLHGWPARQVTGAARRLYRTVAVAVAPVGLDGHALPGGAASGKSTIAVSKLKVASCSGRGSKFV
ncbi:unnamed protein product [Polarella glacialis]|uniref:J domain-containing protein n=1 Tax=Polarella glacialis TaxID=89957 RepID=A0A813IPT0_POLGL|nr:unnamed protein product [Polarella glacialis]